MKLTPTRIAGIAVTGAAFGAIVLSQAAFAQQGKGDFGAGTSRMIGRQAIAPTDDRFAPAALAIIHAASSPAAKGTKWFSKTIRKTAADETTWFNETIYKSETLTAAGGGDMRPLTNAELALVETLFVNTDLGRARVSVSGEGIKGRVTNRDLRVDPRALDTKANQLVDQKSQMLSGAKLSGGG